VFARDEEEVEISGCALVPVREALRICSICFISIFEFKVFETDIPVFRKWLRVCCVVNNSLLGLCDRVTVLSRIFHR